MPPLLSDIISCPAEFRVAIENFLDPYLNYYVVTDMNEAMNAVNLLSSASKGRANFFVLNDFEETQPKKFLARGQVVLDVLTQSGRSRKYEAKGLALLYRTTWVTNTQG